VLTDEQFKVVKKVFDQVSGMFEFVSDQNWWKTPEHWEDPQYIEQQLQAGKIQGDCDNFTLACRYLLNQHKVPNRIVMCNTEDNEGHLVCEAEGWILDNRQNRVRSWGELPYTWVKISGYHVGDPWHEVAA
jgi:predicted transglutaminase-like cysteine proteinase